MTEYDVEIEDGLAELIEEELPNAVSVEQWISFQAEKAICETHVTAKKEKLQNSAQVSPIATEDGE